MIETAKFPRPTDKEELLLRLVDEISSTATELVERSSDRIGTGTVYKTLERMREAGWLSRAGRWYTTTHEGRLVIEALDAAERVYRNGTHHIEGENECLRRV